MPSDDRAMRSLAATQHNLITLFQTRQLGYSDGARRHLLRVGILEPVYGTVYRTGGAAPAPLEPMLAAQLSFGGSATGALDAAAAVWGLPGFKLDPPHTLINRSERRGKPTPFPLHTTRNLTDDHITLYQGVRVTTPARTIRDLAPQLGPIRYGMLVDKLWSRGLLTGQQYGGLCNELARRGRDGTVKSRAIMGNRDALYVPPDSNVEGRAFLILQRRFPGQWRKQVHAVGEQGWIGLLDLRHVTEPAAIEIDSALHHASITDTRHDQDRDAQLDAAGIEVARVPEWDVWHDADKVLDKAHDVILRARERRLGGR